MARTTFSGPVASQNGFEGEFSATAVTVASAPAASAFPAGTMVYVSNGAAGSPVMAFSDGTNWLRCDTRAVISQA